MRELAEQRVPNLGMAIAKGIKAGMFLKSLRNSMESRVREREKVKGSEVREVCLGRSGRHKDYVVLNVVKESLWLKY